METSDFRAFLASRDDGYWELLATAVGAESSVRKTVRGLTGSAFASGCNGPAVRFSLVERRIDALAVYQPRLVAELSASWTKPVSLSDDDMDQERDFLIAAWASATRYLVAEHAVTVQDLRSEVPAIRDEANVYFGAVQDAPSTWDELVRLFAQHEVRHQELRALDRVQLDLGPINHAMLEELLSVGAQSVSWRRRVPTSLEFHRLRVLRGREGDLTLDASQFLCDRLWQEATSDQELLTESSFCVAVEVALVVAPDLRARLTKLVADTLSSNGNPEDLSYLSYVLLGSGWKMP